MRNALITGGLGFVGSFIARQLLREGHVDQVVALDHFGRYVSSLRPGFVDHRSARLVGIQDQIIVERGEAKYASVMMHLIARYEPEYVFHLAALPLAKIGNLIAEEAQDGSIRSTANLVEAIAARQRETKYRVKRFVYASSSMVYGDFVSETATEDHPTKPKELYGTMKLAGEIVAFGLGQYYDVPVSAVRPSAVYGPTDMNRRVSQIFIERAMAGESLNIMGADEPLDFTYVTDTANGFVLAGAKEAAVKEVIGGELEPHEISSLLSQHGYQVHAAIEAFYSNGRAGLPALPKGTEGPANEAMERDGVGSKRARPDKEGGGTSSATASASVFSE
mgnify:CR=1 FL=1